MKQYVGSFIVVLYISWLFSFCLDCYWYSGPAAGVEGATGRVGPPYAGSKEDNIFWFIQLSDIHLSVYYEPSRISDLELFVNQVLETVTPSLLLVTGDLTDSKDRNQIFAKQFETEWLTYNRILRRSSLLRQNKTVLIDVRGNHDAFDVKSQDNDFFREYAMSGDDYNPVLLWRHKLPFGRYSFLAIDATPIPGPRRPYNFFGHLDKAELDKIEKAIMKTSTDNMTFVLSHYPSSVITTDHPRLKRLLEHSIAHLCGHLHHFFGLAPHMYGRHPDGHLELELSDWKHNRRFRLLAVDHDILSFTDTNIHDCWPLVLITNPTNSKFIVPSKEPLARILQSTHIRILAFSPFTISKVTVSIDNGEYVLATLTGSSLYTLPWKPSHYSTGIHSINVVAQDSRGNVKNVKQTFSLDGTQSSFELIPQFILLTDFRSLIRMSYFFIWLLLITYLILPMIRRAFLGVKPVIEHKSIFIPLLIFIIYNCTGPLYVAEVLTDTYGTIWAHGVYAAGHFVPGSLTYLHAGLELCLFLTPLSIYLRYLTSRGSGRSRGCHMTYHVIMVTSVWYEIWGLRRVVISYGVSTVLISPGYSWGFLMSLVLIGVALKNKYYRRFR